MALAPNEIQNDYIIPSSKIVVFKTKWYPEHINNMVSKYVETIESWGGSIFKVYTVSGVVELPLAVQTVIKKENDVSLVACFGAVVKGETYHFESITNESMRALGNIILESEVPVINEVLPVYNLEQLKARSGNDKYNKGIEAAIATAEMLKFYDELSG